MSSVQECLAAVGVPDPQTAFADCATLAEEWAIVKKQYFKRALTVHPDKGGSDEAFRDLQSAFEVLREVCAAGGVASLVAAASQSTAAQFQAAAAHRDPGSTPSWDFYAEATAETFPIYRAEFARSGRAKCMATAGKVCTPDPPLAPDGRMIPTLIEKGELRVGWFDAVPGSYGHWCHLRCWRVPSRVWLGLPDPDLCSDLRAFERALLLMDDVLICGLSELPPEALRTFALHTMDKRRWAALRQPRRVARRPARAAAAQGAATQTAPSASEATDPSSALVPKPGVSSSGAVQQAAGSDALVQRGSGKRKPAFVTPQPGLHGAVPGCLQGETVVITGTFPELGGGAGLRLGKDRAKDLVESFGGKVTGSVSGRTTLLLCGKEPGYKKVSEACATGKARLVTLSDLKAWIEGRPQRLEGPGPSQITIGDFSPGFYGNSLASKNSKLTYTQPRARHTDSSALQTVLPAGAKAAKGKKRAASASTAEAKKTKKLRAKPKPRAACKSASEPTAAAEPASAATRESQRAKRRSAPIDLIKDEG
jgi:hypothetical protein